MPPTTLAPPPAPTGETLTLHEAARVVNELRPDLKVRAFDVFDWALLGYPVGPGYGPRLATTRTGNRYTTTRAAVAEFLAAVKDLPRS